MAHIMNPTLSEKPKLIKLAAYLWHFDQGPHGLETWGWKHDIYYDINNRIFVVPNFGSRKDLTIYFDELPKKICTLKGLSLQYHVDDHTREPVMYTPRVEVR